MPPCSATPPVSAHGPAVWEVTLQRLGEVQARSRLADQVRGEIRERLKSDPGTRELVLETPLYQARVRHRSGAPQPGSPVQLLFSPTGDTGRPGERTNAPEGTLPILCLPDPTTEVLGAQLVGLDSIRDEVLLRLTCPWDGRLDAWSEHTGNPVPEALRAHFTQAVPLFLFEGDPGTGKSALSRVLADRYCRETGVAGRLVSLTTEARGNGTVGDFGNRLRAAFSLLERLPDEEFKGLVIDEADALAMRRSEEHSHQEDRAGTATLLQCLDTLAGRPRVAIFFTTNLGDTVDAAIRRRAVAFSFPRPNQAARQALLRPWLPHFGEVELQVAAALADGMTPADLARTMTQVCLDALRQERPISTDAVNAALCQTERTGRV